MELKKQLDEIGFNPKEYLRVVRMSAYHNGYDPNAVKVATDDVHKLTYTTPSGKVVPFGRVGYGDFHIWSFLERKGKVQRGYADKKRNTFIVSHSAMKGQWRDNPYSPNWLSIRILWD